MPDFDLKLLTMNNLTPFSITAPEAPKKSRFFCTKTFTSHTASSTLPVAHANISPFQSMKNKLSLILGAVSLAATVGAHAQTAVTDPVGYVTSTVAASSGAVRGETLYGATLFNKVEFSGVVATVAGTTLNFTGTPFTAGAFGPRFFIEVTNGAGEGVNTDIVSNTANSIVTLDDISGFITAGTSTVKIRAHQTVSTVFGAANSVGLLAGASLDDADQIVLLDPVTQLPKVIFFSTDEFSPGWVDATLNPAADEIIAPGQGVIIKRKAATNLSIVQVGHVKLGKTVVPVEKGENIIAVPLATGVTIDNSGLGATVTKGPDLASADQVIVGNGLNSFTTLFNSTDEFSPGWIDASLNPQGTFLLKEGTAVLLKNTAPTVGNTAYNWTFPAQVVAP